jgi:hypothetical protein
MTPRITHLVRDRRVASFSRARRASRSTRRARAALIASTCDFEKHGGLLIATAPFGQPAEQKSENRERDAE